MPTCARNTLAERVIPLFWFALLASAISHATGKAFLIVFPVLTVAVLALGLVALAWIVRCARLLHSRPGQFGIGTLLLLMFYCAVFLSFVQWLAVELPTAKTIAPADKLAYPSLLLGCALLVMMSLVPTLLLVEGAVWAAVRLTRWLIGTNISDSADPNLPTD